MADNENGLVSDVATLKTSFDELAKKVEELSNRPAASGSVDNERLGVVERKIFGKAFTPVGSVVEQ